MLKKLQNKYEKLTNDYVDEVCKRYGALTYAKVRLADVFKIEGSGISNELYSYALKAHFDTIVYDSDLLPLFAVEFDGSTHIFDQKQIDNDLKKNTLCEELGLPLLRISSDHLNKEHRGTNLLSWFIEVWFASQWFYKAQEEGKFSYEEPFLPMSFQSIPGKDREFPLWLSRSARGKIASLNMKGHLEDFSPTAVVWMGQNNDYHCLAWIVVKDSRVVFTKNTMKGQQFPAPIQDLLEDITVLDLTEKLINVLNNKDIYQTIEQLNQEIINHRSQYQIISGGGTQHKKIENWS